MSLEGRTYLLKDLGVYEMEAVAKIHALECLQMKITEKACLECPMFHEHFGQGIVWLSLEEKAGHLRFQMSEEALQLHPEYQMSTQVLRHLGYIKQKALLLSRDVWSVKWAVATS